MRSDSLEPSTFNLWEYTNFSRYQDIFDGVKYSIYLYIEMLNQIHQIYSSTIQSSSFLKSSPSFLKEDEKTI